MEWHSTDRKCRQDALVLIWNEGDSSATQPVIAIYQADEFRIKGLGQWYPVKVTHYCYVEPPEVKDV